MLGPERLLADGQGPLVERSRLGILPGFPQKIGECLQTLANEQVRGRQPLLAQRQGLASLRGGRGVLALAKLLERLVVELASPLKRGRWRLRRHRYR